MAEEICSCSENDKARKLKEFENHLKKLVFYFWDEKEYSWPSVLCWKNYGDGWVCYTLDEVKITFDWRGVAANLEEFARYICSDKIPKDYAVERVFIDFKTKTTDHTAVYMPRRPEDQ